GTLARGRRHGPRSVDLEEPGPGHGRRGHGEQRAGQGLDVHRHARAGLTLEPRRALAIAGAVVTVAGLALGTVRVVGHERRELEHRGGPARVDALRRTDPHATEQTV